MEKSPLGSLRREITDADQFSLREWGLKARISRENTLSRRFSASHIRSFREEAPSFRSNITISSTASSPGYHPREEIDPSTYSFTNALKALQARSINTWECLSPDGFALNSKWNEAEKYICNPLSGEVPMECLSAKTLSGRSFRGLTSRMTMSAPLIYPSHSRLFHSTTLQHKLPNNAPIQEEKKVGNYMKTRDVGTQSTPTELSSSSPSPASTPPIQERSIKCNLVQSTDSTDSSSISKSKSEEEVEVIKQGMIMQEEEGKDQEEEKKREEEKDGKKTNCYGCRFRQGGGGDGDGGRGRGRGRGRGGGCFSLRNMWTRKTREREKHKPKPTNTSIYLCHTNNGLCQRYI